MQRLQQTCWLGPWLLLVTTLWLVQWWQPVAGSFFWQDLLLLSGLSLVLAWLSAHAIRIYPTEAGLMGYAWLVGILGGLLLLAAAYFRTQGHAFYPAILFFQIPAFLLYTCWTALHCALTRKNKKISADLQQQQSAASLHREAALFKLRQQLQPHFLYNSLNSINALIALSPKEAQQMVVKLSDFLRSAVKQDGAERIPLAEELAYIQNYLDIELIRLGHRLRVAINNEAAPACTLPPLLLQPLLENAIKYGLYGVTEQVTIHLELFEEEDMLVCRISNPFSREQSPGGGTGFGLRGLQQRLQLLFARADLLHLSRTENQFTATLKIPQS